MQFGKPIAFITIFSDQFQIVALVLNMLLTKRIHVSKVAIPYLSLLTIQNKRFHNFPYKPCTEMCHHLSLHINIFGRKHTVNLTQTLAY